MASDRRDDVEILNGALVDGHLPVKIRGLVHTLAAVAAELDDWFLEDLFQQDLVGIGTLSINFADGEALPYSDGTFDHVYGHGVIQYTADPGRLVRECYRVLKPGGTGIFMVYNRISWLNALSKVMKVKLEPGENITMSAISSAGSGENVKLLRENQAPTEREIREAISGNLCRCTGYQNIVKAVQTAAEKLRQPA